MSEILLIILYSELLVLYILSSLFPNQLMLICICADQLEAERRRVRLTFQIITIVNIRSIIIII